MKAREPKLGLRHFDAAEIDVRRWIWDRCANYDEAAEFFCVSKRTIERWMTSTEPPAIAARLVYVHENRGVN